MVWNSRTKRILTISALVIVFFVAIGFSGKRHHDKTINEVIVKIENQEDNYFIDNLEIISLLNADNTDYVLGLRLGQLDLKELENRVLQHPFVKDVEVFKDLKGNLMVDVYQTKPIARVINPDGEDHYVSVDGDILPVSNKFTARVPLVQLADQSLLDTTLIATEEGQKVFEFIEYVQSDEFWSAQVAHISVDQNMEVSILPQVTKQIVEFGPIEDIDEKFKKLKIFYKKILPGKGWNYYETVSLKYKDQIVAKKP